MRSSVSASAGELGEAVLQFSWERMVDSHHELYERLAGSGATLAGRPI